MDGEGSSRGVHFASDVDLRAPNGTSRLVNGAMSDHDGASNGHTQYDDGALEEDEDDANGDSDIRANFAPGWNTTQTRPRNGSGSSFPSPLADSATDRMSPDLSLARIQRPAAPVRTPSHTYAPQRRPPAASQRESHTVTHPRSSRPRDPATLYQSQERAYVQRLRQDERSNGYFSPLSSDFWYTDSELEDESPSERRYEGDDIYETSVQVWNPDDTLEPTAEELKVPENRERLEWHSMLASVLMGDVVKQEKRRLIGTTEGGEAAALKAELFIGVRAKNCGRSIAAQKRMIMEAREKADSLIEEVIHFQIRGKNETGKTPLEQVAAMIDRWERCEHLWPTYREMVNDKPAVQDEKFTRAWDSLVAWNNITQLINTQLRILQNWVGNEELDFGRPMLESSAEAAGIGRETSFLDRIMKEDNLKSLTGESNMLDGLSRVIGKAKKTLIQYAEDFEKRHLPPYVEELLLLIGFPTRLIEEIIGLRLKYAERMKEPVTMMTNQLILQFQSVLQLAVKIKQEYTGISQPEPGWDLPPCMDENFEQVVLQGLIYYFKLVGWRISANRNTFKEAEILETEWNFVNMIGRYIEGGDIEIAEQFRYAFPPLSHPYLAKSSTAR